MRPLEPFLVLFFFFCGAADECQEPSEIETIGPQAWRRHTSAIYAGKGWVEELLANNVRSP